MMARTNASVMIIILFLEKNVRTVIPPFCDSLILSYEKNLVKDELVGKFIFSKSFILDFECGIMREKKKEIGI